MATIFKEDFQQDDNSLFIQQLRWSLKNGNWEWLQLYVDDKKDNNSRFYAGPETQHGRQKKDNNSRFYIRGSGLEIRPSTALKFLTIIERKAKN